MGENVQVVIAAGQLEAQKEQQQKQQQVRVVKDFDYPGHTGYQQVHEYRPVPSAPAGIPTRHVSMSMPANYQTSQLHQSIPPQAARVVYEGNSTTTTAYNRNSVAYFPEVLMPF